ncbi:unnamed protein product [Adineta ricciae]|uniref:ADP ribosyltransferase domain-containing protein n=1 Tax=Adineta ricciae TaxID=249248 RepID=A0A815L7K2_ADIRI|nr:unnamed protein product [Adineta ricciae]CAF1616517.1 unnamed protein product [Adineta ricciae]
METRQSDFMKRIKQTAMNLKENIEQIRNIIIVWLIDNILYNNPDFENTLEEIRQIISDIYTFTDNDQCIEFILNITNCKVCMITSESVGLNLIPCIHDISQIDSILIVYDNKIQYVQWIKKWYKIRNVCLNSSSICKQLKQITRQYEQNNIPMSFVTSGKRLNQLDPLFMYTQLMKEILLTIEFDDTHIREFVNYYGDEYVDNKNQWIKIKQFVNKYHEKEPIWWYTTEEFLYGTLNRALRIMNGEVIVLMGFFITDLHRHIEERHKQQYNSNQSVESFTVYRGQGLLKKDFDELVQSKGGLISFNNFLSTSKDRDVSLLFAPHDANNPDLISILFIMKIDPSKSTTSFTSINDLSNFVEEEEVLFSMHTIFRIDNIKQSDENEQIFEVHLLLTDDTDEELCMLTQYVRKENSFVPEGWHRLSSLLIELDQPEIAERIYKVLLSQTVDETEIAFIYDHLGSIKRYQGQYQDALLLHKKAVEKKLKSLPSIHRNMGVSYINIGIIHSDMGDYSNALSSFKHALVTIQLSLPSNHPDVAVCYSNIGMVYDLMGDYVEALLWYKKVLTFRQQSLPSNHPDLAAIHSNIGTVYFSMGDHSKALSSHLQALMIRQKSLPSNHHVMASSYNNIGIAYLNISDYSKALSSFEQALRIREELFHYNHPDIAESYNNIGAVYHTIGDYPKALSLLEQALKIRQNSLSSDHPDVAKSYCNCGFTYCSMGDYPNALLSLEQALKILQQSLSSDHPDIATLHNNIGMVYLNTDNYTKALSYFEHALKIRQKSLPSNHPDVAACHNNIGILYSNMGDYSKALSSQEHALRIRQQSLPSNHPEIAISYNNIGVLYYDMKDYPKALLWYERALTIQQQLFPSNHLDIARSQNNIGMVYYCMGKYTKAFSLCSGAVKTLQQTLPSDHPDMQKYKRNVENIKKKL